MRHALRCYLFLLFFIAPPAFADDDGFKQIQLNDFVNTSIPNKKKTVEIVVFQKMKFKAVIGKLPYIKKTTYLQHVLAGMHVNPVPTVTQGIQVRLNDTRQFPLYIVDDVAARMLQDITVDQEVLLFGYHIFNSDHGPGILVSGYDL